MASFPFPIARALRLSEAFEAGRKGVPRAKFFTPVRALRDYSPGTLKWSTRHETRNKGVPVVEDLAGQIGRLFKKPDPQQLSLPTIERQLRQNIHRTIPEMARRISMEGVKKKASIAFPKSSKAITRFQKGVLGGALPHGNLPGHDDIASMPYKIGRLFRSGYPAKHKVAGLFPGTAYRLGARDRGLPRRVLGNDWRDQIYRSELARRYRKVRRLTPGFSDLARHLPHLDFKGTTERAIRKTNAAMSQRFSFPTKIRTTFSDENIPSYGTRTSRVSVTGGYVPLAEFAVESQEFGRKLSLTKKLNERGAWDAAPVTQTGNFSIRPNARLGERVRNIRQVVHQLRQKYPGTHEWEVYHGRRVSSLRYTRPNLPR